MAVENIAGEAKLYYFTTAQWGAISNTAAITAAELATGTDITGTVESEELIDRTGFKNQTSSVDTPGYASRDVANIPGRRTKGAGMLRYNSDPEDTAIKDLLSDNTTGALLWAPHGTATGDDYEAQTIRVMDNSFDDPTENGAQTYAVECSQGITIKGTLAA